ncbi:MAG TPA: DUF3034 family protein [Steroidobacteraceae bacterium]|jgi:hypothetical protein|nr:DUF3034 family protein [Steroidobacteraceae bacterium]
MLKRVCAASTGLLLVLAAGVAPAGDRLAATGGIMNLEGSAGGGLTPWALIAGLGTDGEIGASAFCTQVKPQDFRLDSCGVAAGFYDRTEFSLARQAFNLGATAPGQNIDQTIVGGKLRLFGNAVLDQNSPWPQLALGMQWKHNSNFDLIPRALGAKHADGTDVYLAATKVWLDGPLGRSWLADLTLRESNANQMGILGFGGPAGNYHLLAEGSVGMFVSGYCIIGAEYRQKPNNLPVFREDDFRDVFVAFVPVKYFSVTLAYADLGNIANRAAQAGSYVSIQGSW